MCTCSSSEDKFHQLLVALLIELGSSNTENNANIVSISVHSRAYMLTLYVYMLMRVVR